MSADTPLNRMLKQLIREVLKEKEFSTGNYQPEIGTVLGVNPDGTIAVQSDMNHYDSCAASTQDCYTIGIKVTVIVADGVQVAIPTSATPGTV